MTRILDQERRHREGADIGLGTWTPEEWKELQETAAAPSAAAAAAAAAAASAAAAAAAAKQQKQEQEQEERHGRPGAGCRMDLSSFHLLTVKEQQEAIEKHVDQQLRARRGYATAANAREEARKKTENTHQAQDNGSRSCDNSSPADPVLSRAKSAAQQQQQQQQQVRASTYVKKGDEEELMDITEEEESDEEEQHGLEREVVPVDGMGMVRETELEESDEEEQHGLEREGVPMDGMGLVGEIGVMEGAVGCSENIDEDDGAPNGSAWERVGIGTGWSCSGTFVGWGCEVAGRRPTRLRRARVREK